MKRISSIFNYCFIHSTGFFVYNTLKSKLYRVDEQTYYYLKEKSCNTKYESQAPKLFSVLNENKLIVSTDEDELITAKHHANLCIYENKLDVTIIPTQGCNFRCVYCFEDHTNISMSEDSEKAVINFFKRNIHKYKAIKVSWFGGEPLLEKQRVLRIMDVIKKYCEKNHVPLIGEMITNGYLLDIDTFKALTDRNVLYYEVTIDGFEKNHNYYRPLLNGAGTYDRIVSNLLDIQQNFKSKRYKIIIRTNYDKNTISHYKSFVQKMKSILGDDKHFEFLGSAIADWGGDSVNLIREELIDSNEPSAILYEKYAPSVIGKDMSQIRCSAGKYHGFIITPDASIHKCAKVSFNASVLSTEHENDLGYITNSGQICWDEGKVAKYLTFPEIQEKCSKCCWIPVCMLSMCPNTIVKGKALVCRMNKNNISKIRHDLFLLIENGKYVDLSNCQVEESVYEDYQ